MCKILKKANCIILILIMLLVSFAMPFTNKVKARTLRDLKSELKEAEEKLAKGEADKKFTQEQIAKRKSSINAINLEISNITKETENLENEIVQLNEQIASKEQEIKDILNYYQLANGESAYLEYVFEAASFTDFIYRLAVAEQLSKYNEQLIDEYNATIKKNEEKKKELASKKISLNEKQNTLQKEMAELGNQLGDILDENVTFEDEVKSLRKLVNTYENLYKCGLDEDITSCGVNKLPVGTAFYRPVISGRVSANYGIYYPWGYAMMHYGMDIAGTGHGANVYAMADGKVAFIIERNSCGGNMLYLHHNINGVRYTTAYYHLASINVKVGDVVTTNTVIGRVGGNPSYETWDKCSTGTHLHIQIATTNIEQGTGFYTKFTSRSFDPRRVLNIPALGVWFNNRTTKY